uniref:Helicase VP6 n=1 Tax=Changuinola virus TaxID=40052 RepID=U5YIH1_9REOV|nr:helicase VP6 [Changuinola virus]
MSIAVLLVPGDLIEKIRPELAERQIQVDLVSWKPKEDKKEEEDNLKDKEDAQKITTTEEKSDASRLGQTSDGDKKAKTKSGEGEGESGKGDNSEEKNDTVSEDSGGGEQTRKRPEQTGNKDGQSDSGAGGDRDRQFVVMAEGIARKIKQRYGSDLGVYPDKGTILYLEKHVQNELGFDKELIAQQQEVYKVLQKKKKDKDSTMERVISMKKLIDLVGGSDVQEKPISARQSGVRLVTNNIKHVLKATAYFTAPTGDVNWKKVAREASKNGNIMAYHSESENVSKDLLHLIDHL